MAASSHSSGDLLIDRRFGYAAALTEAGDHAAAADLLEQITDVAPHWVAAWVALGAAAERGGDLALARTSFAQATMRDTTGVHGAALHLARVDGRRDTPVLPPSYVAALFDDYAPRFDRHLVERLAYRGPAVILAALDRTACPPRFGLALDLGCGTGLMGRAIRSRVDRLEGIDLSPAMVGEARRAGIYDDLAVAGIAEALAGRNAGTLDLALAADVFVYLGALDGVLGAVGRALRAGGTLAFTVQKGDAGVRLGDDMRVTHAPGYLRHVIAGAGLQLVAMEDAATRQDAGRDVPGLVVVARRP